MTPSMRLNDLIRKYQAIFSGSNPWATGVVDDLNEAFALGHEFGLARAAEASAAHLRELRVERVVVSEE